MDETGADARPMREFLAIVCEQGGPLQNIFDLAVTVGAPRSSGRPQAAAERMRDTMKPATSGGICEVGAVFTFGREDMIPHMSSQMLQGGCLPAGETKIPPRPRREELSPYPQPWAPFPAPRRCHQLQRRSAVFCPKTPPGCFTPIPALIELQGAHAQFSYSLIALRHKPSYAHTKVVKLEIVSLLFIYLWQVLVRLPGTMEFALFV
jgi:hypothetical protein